MAQCFPDYEDITDSIESAGEVSLYKALKNQLPDSYYVFHSVSWIVKRGSEARDGEADFLICHPQKGLLIIEVKGGGVRADERTGKWTSTDKKGMVHDIENPFRQAMGNKYSILGKLKEHTLWPKLALRRIGAGHAVFFPSLTDARRLQGPEAPPEIIGDMNDLARIEQWIEEAFLFWADNKENESVQALGQGGMDLVRRIFARIVDARPLLSATIVAEETERLRLTSQQVQILDLLSRQARVAISGGAGTGKTVLAVEKARRLASEGFRTLLTCYNVPLAESLKAICANDKNLEVIAFHKLCKDMVDHAQSTTKRDFLAEAKSSYPGKDLWDHYYPIALSYVIETSEHRYDAVVVDEGQDFGEEFWMPIELILKDSRSSPLYIFYDENQNVYSKASTFPTDTAPIILSINCRNTKRIHGAAYKYYSGQSIQEPSIIGNEIGILDGADIRQQARKIHDLVTKLLVNEKLPCGSIAVLIADRMRRKEYEKTIMSLTLPSGVAWGNFESDPQKNKVVVESVARFKGLEADVLILWGLDTLPRPEHRETLYVGMSRAKSLLYLCGSSSVCKSILAEKTINS